MNLETIERLVKLHTEMSEALLNFKVPGGGSIDYSFQDSVKATNAIAKAISHATEQEKSNV